MYVRLAFAVAAHLEPEILLVDEVLAVGDVAFQKKCLGKMDDVAAAGRTVLFVSHNMGAIQRLCPRSLLLDEGRIVLDGPSEQVVSTYITEGIDDVARVALDHDADRPMRLRELSLRDGDGVVQTHFRYDQGLRVVIDYEVNQPVENCSVWMGVRTTENVWAFNTADCDTDPGMLGARRPGRYRTEIDLPARWLNAGKYQVVVGIRRNAPVLSYDRVDELTFTVVEVATPESLRTGMSRAGVLQPFFEWKTSPAAIPEADLVGT